MKITLVVVGRLKAGPERELCQRYATRLGGAGRAGFPRVETVELSESAQRRPEDRMADEARAILAALPDDAALIVFDERGKSPDSAEFASVVARYRDEGASSLGLVIGGPDGLAPAIRAKANHVFSFGRMTVPHQIIRALVMEQLYRASTILSGHPYHRG